VLNAFRHHRGRHPEPAWPSVARSRCAQRLSASQRSAPEPADLTWTPPVTSAQRLSASQRSAPLAVVGLAAKRGFVLNAFRHHRGRHNRLPKKSRGVCACSTPFGITEV